jgi:WD40 repeat protein
LAFFGPNELAAGGSDNLIRLWDLSTGQEVGQLAGHQGSVMSLDSNGQILVSGSYDTVVRIWTIKDRVASAPRPTTELK